MTNAELVANLQPSQRKEYADILARLLGEYTAKLRSNVEKLERMQTRFQLICTASLVTFLAIFGEALYAQMTKSNIREAFSNSMTVAGVVGSILGAIVPTSFFAFCYSDIMKRKMLTLDIRSNMEQLAKLIRYSSQVQEVGITDFARRLELDFKTTDAEETLDLAQTAVKPSKQSTSGNGMVTKTGRTLSEPELVWEEPVARTGTK